MIEWNRKPPEEAQKAGAVNIIEEKTRLQQKRFVSHLYSPDDWKSPSHPSIKFHNRIINEARQEIIRQELSREFGIDPGTEKKLDKGRNKCFWLVTTSICE
ncbi:10569_t:CDS:2, partial [Racocetra persica]